MTTRVLDAELVIRGRADGSSTKALEDVAKRVESAAKSVDNFRKAQEKFAGARGKFNQAQKAVEDAGKAMSAIGPKTKAMEATYRSAVRAVQQASRSFEAQKSAAIGAKHELEGYGISVSRLAAEQARLRTESDHATNALARQGRQAERAQRLRTAAGGVVAAGGALVVGHAAREGARETIKATAQGEHERVRMEASGMTPAEIAEAEKLSAEMSGKYRSVGQTKILHLLRNARSIVGNFEEASQIIEPLLQTYVVAQGAHPERSEELEADFDKLVKGMEIKGVTQDMPKFKHYLDNMSKALNVFGDTLRPTDYYETFKYGRAATNALSDEFMLEVAPTFAQEMGGSSAGKAMSTFYGTLIGGKMKDVAAKRFVELGLADPSKILRTKTGAVKGLMPNGIATGRLAAENPYAWVNQVLLPALAAHGITDPKEIQDQIAALFKDSTAAQMVSVLATQQSRIEKDRALIKGAKGSEAAELFQQRDPYVAFKSVTEQFGNLLQAAGSPLAEPAAAALNHIAGGLNALTEAAREHPVAASGGLLGTLAAGGAVSYQSALSAMKFFKIISPETAARWGVGSIIGSPFGVVAGVGAGGAAAAYVAASTVRDNPEAFQSLVDNPMSGAMGGDYALAQAIMHPEPQEVRVKVEVGASEGFWARVTSIFRNPNGEERTVTSTGSVGKSMPEAMSFDGPQP